MKSIYIIIFLFVISIGDLFAQQKENIPRLENPMSVQYLGAKLEKAHPRLVLNPTIEKYVKKKIESDPLVKNYYAAIKLNAEKIKAHINYWRFAPCSKLKMKNKIKQIGISSYIIFMPIGYLFHMKDKKNNYIDIRHVGSKR